MQGHWHNIYVKETVVRSVEILRGLGIRVDYTPKPHDPEEPNGYIEPSGVISSCIRWRAGNATATPGGQVHAPAEAMACFQLGSESKNFQRLREAVERNFNIVQNCGSCSKSA